MYTFAELAQKYLNDEERIRFYDNCEMQGVNISAYVIESDDDQFIWRAFIWSDTQEGSDYWLDIANRISIEYKANLNRLATNLCGEECMWLADCPEEPRHCETGIALLQEKAEGREER